MSLQKCRLFLRRGESFFLCPTTYCLVTSWLLLPAPCAHREPEGSDQLQGKPDSNCCRGNSSSPQRPRRAAYLKRRISTFFPINECRGYPNVTEDGNPSSYANYRNRTPSKPAPHGCQGRRKSGHVINKCSNSSDGCNDAKPTEAAS